MTVFRARYKVLGGHVGIKLFSSPAPNTTYAHLGGFAVRSGDEFLALCKAMPGVMFLDEELTDHPM